MADNLIFRIGFDLEKAVNDAGQDWGKKYAKKLEDLMAKRPVRVRFDFEKLEDVKTRLAQLKIEPVTPETKSAIKELARELQTLAKALEAVQKYSAARGGATADAVRASKIQLNAEKARSQAALTAQRAARAEANLAQARLRDARAANVGTAATHAANKAYHEQAGYLQRLAQRMAAYWSVRQVGNFLTSVREVTAQFELQRVSLGAIIQDQNRANQLFGEIKAFALKSPVSIMDLTKYTKQLAAYKIGVDELFETTKKLTDVSVGLGVSMDRVVLAYGQTRATGYLRASEIRQFTEMGVPIVEELAAKLSKMNGELVTAADVMELVSKRGISFELVKEVFDDMTSAGGMFYNMQEKQGNTLFGLWAKLGDAASVMYDEIGNTEGVNEGMKTAIGLLTELMRNWKAVADTVTWVVVPNAALLALYKYSTATQRVSAAQNAAAAATERRKAAVLQLSAAIEKGSSDDINAANAALQKAKADEVAAQKATTRMGLLKSGFASVAKSIGAGLGIGLAITAVTTLAYKLFEAYENAHRLDRKLEEIDAGRITLASQSVRNFEYLADVAVKAADGSKKQKDALDELQRTYKEMIPVQDLTIEHLRQLREGTNNASEAYRSLTTAIREYISEQQKQKKLSAIEEEYGSTITDKYKKLYSELTKGIKINVGGRTIKSWVELQFSPEEFERAMVEFEKRATDKAKSVGQKIKESFAAIGFDLSPDQIKALQEVGKWGEFDDGYFITLNEALEEQAERINAVHTGYAGFVGDLGEYGAEMSRIAEVMENKIYKANGKVLESNSFLRKQMQSNEWIKEWTNSLKSNLSSAGVEIKNEWFNFIKSLNPSGSNVISSINFDAILEVLNTDAIRKKLGEHYEQTKNYVLAIQEEYQNLVPQNRTVVILGDKLQQISNQFGVNMNITQQYLMNAGEDIETYAKRIKEGLENAQKNLKQLRFDKSEIEAGVGGLKPVSDKEIEDAENLTKVLTALFNLISGFAESGGGRGDGRVQTLEEINRALREMYERVEDVEKKLGHSKAVEFAGRVYKQELEYLNELGREFGLKFELPTTMKELSDYETEIFNALGKIDTKVAKRALIRQGKLIDSDWVKNSMKEVDRQLKELADRISRTKTAKEFYEKILSQTGDVELAAKVAESIFGQNGLALQKALADQVRGMTNKIELPEGIISADNIIDYKALRQFAEANKDELGEMYSELVKISEQGQKDLAKTYEGYLKDLEKAKTYSDKRIELARYTANQIAEINASTLPQAEKDRLTAEYREREDKEAAKHEWEAFKDMPMYVEMFDDLDGASTAMLTNMRRMLDGLKGKWGEALEPTQLKEMQSRLNAIVEQLARRNPFKVIGDGLGKLRALGKEYGSLGKVENDLTTATERLVGNKAALTEALAAETAARAEYDRIVRESGADSKEAKAAQLRLSAARGLVEQMRKTLNLTEKQVKALQDIVGLFAEAKDEVDEGGKALVGIIGHIRNAKDEVRWMVEAWSSLGDDELWNVAMEGLDGMLNAAESAVVAFTSANPVEKITAGISAVSGLVGTVGKLFWGSKVAKANKEIKRQGELIDRLTYAYGRLEEAADKVFGREYVSNYSRQLEVLRAQQAAYLKQAEAERSKGKKKDKDKIKEYEEQARETADRIKELQDDLVAHFTGSTRADVARQMARSWIDAKASMSDTFAAIKGDYQDLIKNMLVETMAAKIIENAFSQVWKDVDERLKDNDVDGAVNAFINGMDTALTNANDGMEVWWKAMEARGFDMKKLLGESDSEYTGIAKSVAGATSEEINANTAALNTQNYYMSHIDENVAAIRAMLSGGAAVSVPQSVATAAWTDWQQQAMDNYQAIARNTAETVLRCERAAVACEKMARAIKVKGSTSGFNVFLNS